MRNLMQASSQPVQPMPAASLTQRFHRMDENRFGLLMLVPTAIVLAVFLILPILYALVMSLQRVELTISTDKPWVGLKNYADLLTQPAVMDAVPRTLFFAAMTTVVTVVLALVLALVLNEQFVGRKITRVLILLPWAVAPVVNGIMWRYLFQPNYGLINAVLFQLGLIQHYQVWLDNALVALAIAAAATAWKAIPFSTLIILAALQSIPEALFRAAKMDGANVWARFRFVTLPHLRNILIFVVLLQIIVSLQVFDLIYTLTRGGPGQGTVTLSYLIYNNAFERLSMGRASAMAVLLSLLIIGLSGVSLLITMQRRR